MIIWFEELENNNYRWIWREFDSLNDFEPYFKTNKIKIGKDCKIGEVYFEKNISIGDNTELGNGVILRDGIKIGKDCIIKANSKLSSNVIVKDNVTISNYVVIYSDTTIEKNSRIAERVIIGAKSIVGESSIIARDIELAGLTVIPKNSNITKSIKIVGSRDILYFYNTGLLNIGIFTLPIKKWLVEYKDILPKFFYNNAEIEEYLKYFQFLHIFENDDFNTEDYL